MRFGFRGRGCLHGDARLRHGSIGRQRAGLGDTRAIADDATLLDTSEMTIDAAFDAARRIVEASRARWEASR